MTTNSREYSRKWRETHPKPQREFYETTGKCTVCGKSFFRPFNCIIGKKKKIYCSKKCRDKAIRKRHYLKNREKILAMIKQPKYLIQNRIRMLKAYHKNPEKFRARSKLYKKTLSGKNSEAKTGAKKRNLGFIRLNEGWIGCAWHHIDKDRVVAIPDEVHRRSKQKQGLTQHQLFILKYYGSVENMKNNTPQGLPYSFDSFLDFLKKEKGVGK